MKAPGIVSYFRASLSFILSLSLFTLLFSASAQAQKYASPSATDAPPAYFTGTVDSSWFEPLNWSIEALPTSAYHVVIDSGFTVYCGDSDQIPETITPSQSIHALTIHSNAGLVISDQNTAETALTVGNSFGTDSVIYIHTNGSLILESLSDFPVRLRTNSSENMYVDGTVEFNSGRGFGVEQSTVALPAERQIWSDQSTLVFGIAAADFQAQTYGNLILNLFDTLIINQSIEINGDLTINSGTFAFIEGVISGVHAVVYGNMYIRNDAFVRTCMPHEGFNTFSLHGDIDVDETAWFSSTAGMFMELDSDEPQWMCEKITLLRKFKLSGLGEKNMSNNLEITDSLVLENGELITNGFMVTIGTGVDHVGELVIPEETVSKRVNGHSIQGNKKNKIKGKLARWIPANKTRTLKFPVSSYSANRDIEVTITTGNEGGRLAVEFHETVPGTNGLPMFDNDGKKIKEIVENGYWTIEPVEGLSGSSYSVELVFSNNKPVDDPSRLRVIKRPDAAFSWEVPGDNVEGYINSSGEYVAGRKNLVGFSDFTIATVEDGTLPVNLTTFEAQLARENLPELTWKTSTEQENYGFHIQRRKSNTADTLWTEIDFVRGNGTTTQSHFYRYKDESIVESDTYLYQLIQEDYDGTKTTYGPVSVVIEPSHKTRIVSISPNPFNPVTNIYLTVSENSRVNLSVYNLLGQLVTTLVDREMMPGTYPVLFNAQHLSSGNYIIMLTSNGFKESRIISMIK